MIIPWKINIVKWINEGEWPTRVNKIVADNLLQRRKCTCSRRKGCRSILTKRQPGSLTSHAPSVLIWYEINILSWIIIIIRRIYLMPSKNQCSGRPNVGKNPLQTLPRQLIACILEWHFSAPISINFDRIFSPSRIIGTNLA